MFGTTTMIASAPTQYQGMLDAYTSILEKTNTQLGLWLNIGNYLVAILAVIVGVIAIAAAYVIFKNSSEQKKQYKEFLETQKVLLKKGIKDFEKESKRGRDEADNKLETLIQEKTAKLDDAAEGNKKEIQIAIDELKKTKATLGAYTSSPLFTSTASASPLFTTSSSIYGSGFGGSNILWATKNMICSSCGKNFYYNGGDNSVSVMTLTTGSVHCTHCGAVNIPS